MRIDTPRWGSIEIDPAAIIHFETGLAGFPDCARFVVMDHDRDTPLKWLQSIDRPEIAFVIVEPHQVLSAYTVDVPEPVMKKIGWDRDVKPEDVAVFLILNCDQGNLTANLRAPVVVNVQNRRAFQLILDSPDIPLRHPLHPE
jgi:flagellar assembly factor FliW